MQVLIQALLNYAVLGTKGKAFELVDCQMIYETAVANLKTEIEESGAELTHAPLPRVMGDSAQLIQLFQNLLANALKFKAQDRPRIEISVEQQDQQWRIGIRDNGIGIDPKNFGRLFVLFQRLHPP